MLNFYHYVLLQSLSFAALCLADLALETSLAFVARAGIGESPKHANGVAGATSSLKGAALVVATIGSVWLGLVCRMKMDEREHS